MLAHSLLISWLLRLCKPLLKRRRELLRYHRSQLAAGVVAWSGTHDVLVLSRKPGPSAWVGCARHSSSASRCCEERRATGHVSARKSTTAAAAEAEPKKTPPRPWKDTAPLTPAASRAAARALALRKNAWQACTSWARPYRRNRPAQTNCGGALPQRSVEFARRGWAAVPRSATSRVHATIQRISAAFEELMHPRSSRSGYPELPATRRGPPRSFQTRTRARPRRNPPPRCADK